MDALTLLVGVQERGGQLARDGQDGLKTSPPGCLTAEERQAAQDSETRADLMALLGTPALCKHLAYLATPNRTQDGLEELADWLESADAWLSEAAGHPREAAARRALDVGCRLYTLLEARYGRRLRALLGAQAA